jgi:hypothetical protein
MDPAPDGIDAATFARAMDAIAEGRAMAEAGRRLASMPLATERPDGPGRVILTVTDDAVRRLELGASMMVAGLAMVDRAIKEALGGPSGAAGAGPSADPGEPDPRSCR